MHEIVSTRIFKAMDFPGCYLYLFAVTSNNIYGVDGIEMIMIVLVEALTKWAIPNYR